MRSEELDFNFKKLTTQQWFRVYLVGSAIMLVLLIGAVVFLAFQVMQINSTVNDINGNLPQSSCGATVGSDTIYCN